MKNKTVKMLTGRSLRSHRGRNLVAIFAIVLTTMMFTTLFVLTRSMNENAIKMMFRQTGYDAHVSFKSITDEQIETLAGHPDVKEIGRSIIVGTAANEALSGRQVEVRYADPVYAQNGFAAVTTGRLPQSPDEIALDDITLNRLGLPHELGTKVTLEWRGDFTKDAVNVSEFTLCGFWEGNTAVYASMAWVSEDYALTVSEGHVPDAEDLTNFLGRRMAEIRLYSDNDIAGTTDRILADSGLTGLEYGVNLAYEADSMMFMETLPMYGAMVLVFIAGYLIIYNIFQISVTADIQFFGKLKTLGAAAKQIKRILYGQANRLSLMGIPLGLIIGFLLGTVLVPAFVGIVDGDTTVSVNPVIFIGSALFAWLTVIISCLRPAGIAGKVSAMEALRYNDAGGSRRKMKKGKNGASVFRMALSNLGRNKKRTAMVLCSLTLGLVLLSGFYAKNAAFDINMYLSDLTIADFQVSDATSAGYPLAYDPHGTTLRPALVQQIEEFEGLEKMGRLYSQETTVPLSEQALGNIRGFYETSQDALSWLQEDAELWENYQNLIATATSAVTVYGSDGLTWDVLDDAMYLMTGSFDAERFAAGRYVMAVGVGTDDFSATMPTFSVGETVQIEGREYEVMGIIQPIAPLTLGGDGFMELIISADEFVQIWPDNTLRSLYLNVTDDRIEAAAAMLAEYQQNVDSSMPIKSRKTMVEQYENETRSTAVTGNAISIVIAAVGILNFINSMVTAIISRRREFAMLQSVGMTKRQLRRMLMFEGLDYAVSTLAIAFTVSSIAVGLVLPAIGAAYSTFRFTLLPLFVCTPILLAFAVIVPFICFKNLEKLSLVERLRYAD